METQRSKKASLLIWALVAALLSQNLVTFVMPSATFEDQKTYYSPPSDPHSGTPPSGSHHGHTPSHGGSYGTPPSGGGSHSGTPPANCGTPPSPHHVDPSPAPPTAGYHYPPPTYTPTPSTPTITPSPPSIINPPIDPGTPSTPGITIPSPPFSFPSPPFSFPSPPYTCDYWRTHPGLIWGVFGFYGTTLGGTFGLSSLPGIGSHMSLEQALSNTRSDGVGSLYREGTAALLNSMVHTRFPFTPTQVRDNFVSALSSNKAAATQARVFKLANEGRLKPRT